MGSRPELQFPPLIGVHLQPPAAPSRSSAPRSRSFPARLLPPKDTFVFEGSGRGLPARFNLLAFFTSSSLDRSLRGVYKRPLSGH